MAYEDVHLYCWGLVTLPGVEEARQGLVCRVGGLGSLCTCLRMEMGILEILVTSRYLGTKMDASAMTSSPSTNEHFVTRYILLSTTLLPKSDHSGIAHRFKYMKLLSCLRFFLLSKPLLAGFFKLHLYSDVHEASLDLVLVGP